MTLLTGPTRPTTSGRVQVHHQPIGKVRFRVRASSTWKTNTLDLSIRVKAPGTWGAETTSRHGFFHHVIIEMATAVPWRSKTSLPKCTAKLNQRIMHVSPLTSGNGFAERLAELLSLPPSSDTSTDISPPLRYDAGTNTAPATSTKTPAIARPPLRQCWAAWVVFGWTAPAAMLAGVDGGSDP